MSHEPFHVESPFGSVCQHQCEDVIHKFGGALAQPPRGAGDVASFRRKNPRYQIGRNEKRTTDSVVIREVLRDTVVTVEADSSLVRALVECDSLGRARLRELREYRAGTRLPPPKVSIEDNVLTATASIDSMEIYLTLKERYRQDLKAEKEVIIKTVEVNRLNWWQTLWMRLGQVLTAAAVAVGGYKIIKLVKRK